jgi:hypothetical protein
MNKTIITGLILFCFSHTPLWAQQGNSIEDTPNQEEDIIGGIGGTGIREMSRPEILERPEQLERPELLESREALEDLLDSDAAMEPVDMPEKPERPSE